MTPHDFVVEQEQSTPLNYRGPFSKKSCLWQMGEQTFLGKRMVGCCFTCWINDQIMPRIREFHKFTFQ